MPHSFHPDDFPINEKAKFRPTRTYYLKGCIHFKKNAAIYDLTDELSQPFPGRFDPDWADECGEIVTDLSEPDEENPEGNPPEPPTYSIKSCGDMMRTIKTFHEGGEGGRRLADLNITFVSFGSSYVRPLLEKGSKEAEEISRHEIEMCPADDGRNAISAGGKGDNGGRKHETFVRHSVPYFWDLGKGKPYGILYKGVNQEQVEIARVVAYGGAGKDAILVLDDRELNPVVALSTCVILLNGRDAMDH